MPRRLRAAGIAVAILSSVLVVPITVATPAAGAIGDKTTFRLPKDAPVPGGVMLGADGNLWMSPSPGRALVSVTPDGDYSIHPLSVLGRAVDGHGITQTPDGRIWFVESTFKSAVSTDASGNGSKQSFPAVAAQGLATGSDGNLWMTTPTSILRLTPRGGIATFPTGATNIRSIVSSSSNWLLFSVGGQAAVGRVFTDGQMGSIAMPGPTLELALAGDGTLWAAGPDKIYRRSGSGDTTLTIPVTIHPTGAAIAPDGSAWFSDDHGRVIRVSADGGTNSRFVVGDSARGIALGADGNMWVAYTGGVTRFLTGVTPASTSSPTVTGAANTPGTVVTATKGDWKYLPSSFNFQWLRCTANDPGSCAKIAGADKANYTIADADQGAWLQATVSATNLNGASAPAGSALFQVAPKATTTPTQPTNPTPTTPAPVAGVGKATIAPDVTAGLTGPSTVKRKAKRAYAVTFNSPTPRGAVKFSIVNSAGAEAFVLNAGKAVTKKGKKASRAAIAARIPKAVPKGTYTLVAVYRPKATQAATYPVTTLTKPLTLK